MTLKDSWNIARQTMRMMNAQERQEKQRRKQMKVNRTTEATIFEVACGLTVAAAIGLKLWAMCRSNTIDVGELMALAILVIAIVTLLACAYRPHWINTIDERIENSRQLSLLVRSVRVVALLFALRILSVAVGDLAGWERLEWSKYIDMAVFIAVPIYYSIRIHRAK